MRTVVAAIAVALVLVVPLVALFASGGDDGPGPAAAGGGLSLERSPTPPEVIVSVEPALNVPRSADGARSVTLRCVDSDGQLVAAQDDAWPFTDTDGDTLNPHTHMPLDATQLETISSCRLVGTEPLLEGRMP